MNEISTDAKKTNKRRRNKNKIQVDETSIEKRSKLSERCGNEFTICRLTFQYNLVFSATFRLVSARKRRRRRRRRKKRNAAEEKKNVQPFVCCFCVDNELAIIAAIATGSLRSPTSSKWCLCDREKWITRLLVHRNTLLTSDNVAKFSPALEIE